MTKQLFFKAKSILRGRCFSNYFIPLLFFSGFFLFLLYYIDPAVIYSSNGINIHSYVQIMHAPDASSYTDLLYQPMFILELTISYLQQIAFTPGGWTRLASTLIIYLCHYPIAGAIAVTGLALFFYWIFPLYIQACGARRPFFLGFVPAFFLLTICTWYELSYCEFLFPIAGAIVFSIFYQRLQPAKTITTLLLISVLFWCLWYVSQWGSLLFVILIIIYEFFRNKHRIVYISVTTAINAALFYLVETQIPLNMTTNWNDFTIMSGLPVAVISFFPLISIIFITFSRFFQTTRRKTKETGTTIQKSLFACSIIVILFWLCQEPVNRDTRIIARTMHYIINEQWDEILRENTSEFFADFPHKSGILQVFMMHAINHALSQKGQLGDGMFAYPQAVFSYDPLLMLQSMFVHSYVNWIAVLDLSIDLGMVNTAEKIAGEIMENMGPYPEILYRRALVQIAKGNKETAAVFLNKLTYMPFFRARAKRLLSIINDEKALFSEPRIAKMHANKDTVDYFLNSNLDCNLIFRYLLQSNPDNKAAYDYLMSSCLLYDRMDEFAALAPAASAFGYTSLPRHWEEALCLYQSSHSLHSSSGLPFSGLSQKTVERFIEFTKAWIEIKDDPKAANKLAPLFGGSYFFFSIFGYTPGVSLP